MRQPLNSIQEYLNALESGDFTAIESFNRFIPFKYREIFREAGKTDVNVGDDQSKVLLDYELHLANPTIEHLKKLALLIQLIHEVGYSYCSFLNSCVSLYASLTYYLATKDIHPRDKYPAEVTKASYDVLFEESQKKLDGEIEEQITAAVKRIEESAAPSNQEKQQFFQANDFTLIYQKHGILSLKALFDMFNSGQTSKLEECERDYIGNNWLRLAGITNGMSEEAILGCIVSNDYSAMEHGADIAKNHSIALFTKYYNLNDKNFVDLFFTGDTATAINADHKEYIISELRTKPIINNIAGSYNSTPNAMANKILFTDEYAEIAQEHREYLIENHEVEMREHYLSIQLLGIAKSMLLKLIAENDAENENPVPAGMEAAAPPVPQNPLKTAIATFANEDINDKVKLGRKLLTLKETQKFLANGLKTKMHGQIKAVSPNLNLQASKIAVAIDELLDTVIGSIVRAFKTNFNLRPFKTLASRSAEGQLITDTSSLMNLSCALFVKRSEEQFDKKYPEFSQRFSSQAA